MLLNLRTVRCHLLPHVGDLIGGQRLAVRQRHAHHEELVFADRLDLLALLNHDVDVRRSDRRECSARRTNAELIGSGGFDLKVSDTRLFLFYYDPPTPAIKWTQFK